MRSSEESLGMRSRISPLKIALFTGGIDPHYASGLSRSLASLGLAVDVICNSEMETTEMEASPNLRLFTLYATPQQRQSKIRKLLAIVVVYARLIHYAVGSSAQIFH